MSFTRTVALRRFAAPRPLLRAAAPVAAIRQARWTSSKPDDGDLGGPGGQEPIPDSSGISQSWPTLAAIGGVALLVGGYLVHISGKPPKAEQPKGGKFDELGDKVVPSK